MKEEKTMKKVMKYMALTCMMVMFSFAASAQIFICTDDEEILNGRGARDVNEIPIPPINLDDDWIPGDTPAPTPYVPIGDGLLVLTLLGGAYLLNKQSKKALD